MWELFCKDDKDKKDGPNDFIKLHKCPHCGTMWEVDKYDRSEVYFDLTLGREACPKCN
jgi:uncharacterized protein (UPF0212 family)